MDKEENILEIYETELNHQHYDNLFRFDKEGGIEAFSVNHSKCSIDLHTSPCNIHAPKSSDNRVG